MTQIKLGDFLLLTPSLRELMNQRPDVWTAVPDLLWDLYIEADVFSGQIVRASSVNEVVQGQNPEPHIVNLTYPLLDDRDIPSAHKKLKADPFFLHQHVTASYTQALQEHFAEMPSDFKSKPFLDFAPDKSVSARFETEPYQYFTVHSGSDFAPKNWAPENFEELVIMILKERPSLCALELVGPQDAPLFQNKSKPANFKTVQAPLRDVAHVLAGSLFHIDNDSGVHHLAGVMDVPSITIFGPTPPGTWSSLTEQNYIHWGGPHCRPECKGKGVLTCEERSCLKAVKPEDLLVSAKTILTHYTHL